MFFDLQYKINGSALFLPTASIDYLHYRFVIKKLNDILRNFLFFISVKTAGRQCALGGKTDHQNSNNRSQ
jgi:hypothetical protein